MLKSAAVFSDHMVLQCMKPIPVWGWAGAEKEVTAQLGEDTVTVRADRTGYFMAVLPPRSVGRGYTLTLSSENETIRFTDVAIGEVWYAGGQSNMELMLAESWEGERAVAESGCEDIRFYMTPKCAVTGPELEEAEAASAWQVCGPETSGVMSAVAYYFARHLHAARKVPVGILCCAWGGTSISCWMSENQLQKTAAGMRYLENYAALVGDKTDAEYAAEMEAYWADWNAWNDRVQARRRREPGVTWEVLNEECGLCPWPQPAGRQSPFRPAGLYSTMTERICPYSIRGFLYYQGEEDESRYADYDWMVYSLITEWRGAWGGRALPFLFVQLPMYTAKAEWEAGIDDRHWAMLRDQQMKTASTIRHTGLAVLTDCGEFDNIHPLDKETVGRRLALQARAKVYGEDICADAPVMDKVTFAGGRAIVRFRHTGGCLKAAGEKIQGFELAGSDCIFHPAKGQIETDTVVLTADGVQDPLYVRYAWHNYCRANLFGCTGLPAAPFRTDRFSIEGKAQ